MEEHIIQYEERVKNDLHLYLKGVDKVDERLPETPDIEGKWEEIAQAYLPDGIREFQGYPTVSLGWMMYVGMAVAQMWDEDWEHYSSLENIYLYLRDKRGYDTMDEYIRQEVLSLSGEAYTAIESLVSECASRTHNLLMHGDFEPGTKDALWAYVASLRQLYFMGAAVQFKTLGYKMTKL